MNRFRQRYRFNRVVLLAIALLISNIAAMSCAMAYSLCVDCPEHEPVLCVDTCATAEEAINDPAPDSKSDTFRPLAILKIESSIDPAFNPGRISVVDRQPPDPHTSPPLHLQLCVFLK